MHFTGLKERLRALARSLLSLSRRGVDRREKTISLGSGEKPPELGDRPRKVSRKGDPALLGAREMVNFQVAEEYLGVSERQRQKLVKQRRLDVRGHGQNRMITTESLRRYLPPVENPN